MHFTTWFVIWTGASYGAIRLVEDWWGANSPWLTQPQTLRRRTASQNLRPADRPHGKRQERPRAGAVRVRRCHARRERDALKITHGHF